MYNCRTCARRSLRGGDGGGGIHYIVLQYSVLHHIVLHSIPLQSSAVQYITIDTTPPRRSSSGGGGGGGFGSGSRRRGTTRTWRDNDGSVAHEDRVASLHTTTREGTAILRARRYDHDATRRNCHRGGEGSDDSTTLVRRERDARDEERLGEVDREREHERAVPVGMTWYIRIRSLHN